MLFISRRKQGEKVWVVDTDDGVEEAITLDKLQDLVLYRHLAVKGFIVNRMTGTRSVFPYQDPSTITALQLKMKMLLHVDIKTWNGFITDITFDAAAISEPVPIVLSAFGRTVATKVFDNCSYRVGSHKITLVFDDKVALAVQALVPSEQEISLSKETYGVAFDVSQVTDIGLLSEICMQIFSNSFIRNGIVSDIAVLDSIVDEKHRITRITRACECALSEAMHKGIGNNTVKAISKRVKELYLSGRV